MCLRAMLALVLGGIVVSVAVGQVEQAAPAQDVKGPPAQTEPGLVAYWNFDEEEGLAVKDSSGSGLNGKIINPEQVKRVEGKAGKAVEFSGTERYKAGCVYVDGIGKCDFSKAFTVETWIRFNDEHVRQDTCYLASDGAWRGPGWRLIVSYNQLFIQSGDGEEMWGAATQTGEFAGFENNRWYHVAATFDGSVFRLYLDGVEVGVSKPEATLTKGTNALTIGAYSGGVTSVFKGALDEMKLYNRVKSGMEIVKDARLN